LWTKCANNHCDGLFFFHVLLPILYRAEGISKVNCGSPF
jgi:hypothetical protein